MVVIPKTTNYVSMGTEDMVIAFDPCNNIYTGLGNVVGKAFGDGM